jgi:GntR family transcriptional regulator, transcriptional repressor for pyruvate dehydrogenase complex
MPTIILDFKPIEGLASRGSRPEQVWARLELAALILYYHDTGYPTHNRVDPAGPDTSRRDADVATDLDGSAFQRTRTEKIAERIARQIVNHIVDNDLAEGTVLPTERQLVETFGVGRTTLREALRLLESRKVLTIKPGPHGGPVVRMPRPDDLREALTLMLQFSSSSLMEVLEARTALEPVMARLAADRISKEALTELSDSVERMRSAAGDHSAFLAENRRFHSIIAEATGNHILQVFNDTLKTIADGATLGVVYTPTRRQSVAKAHERIVSALRERDGLAAEQAMRDHVAEAGNFWRRKYPDLVSQPVRWVN